MVNVTFSNETNEKVEYLSDLKKLVKYAKEYMKLGNIEFGVIFVDNNEIHELNKTYRNIDGTTILGDIYISLDKAHSQAEEYGHSYKRELSFLLIHGFLHLLGYDHMNPVDEKVMFKLQEEILDGYGIKR